VRFGALAASARGLTLGERELPWGEVGELEAEAGEIVVRTRDGERWAAARLDEVPNAFLLAELADRRGG
jgi:hypothetical protein